MSSAPTYRRLSFWHATANDLLEPRPALPESMTCDVAIVGAGFTGLWTAYYLSWLDPSLRIVVLEREIAGFGASGRNGGWCSALFPASLSVVARRSSRDGAIRLHRALHDTVVEVGRAAADEGIDAYYQRGGTVVLARSKAQLRRAKAEVDEAREWGFGPEDLRLLDESEARKQLDGTHVVGGTYTPHCAAIHPARLVRGLARAVEDRGVRLYEQTPVHSIEPGSVATDAGRVRADVVVRATEAYTARFPGHRRVLAPVYSLMVVTDPLPESFWADAGLAEHQTFSDGRHLVVYGQRTHDGRIAFGGRGAPYHFGSTVRPGHDQEPRVFAGLRKTLIELLPALRGVTFTHGWGGAIGMPRDWHASVGLERATGMAWAGGYVGDGVGTSNLAGRTLADLILDRETDLVDLPWVGHRSRQWEPEPLRWLGINVGLRAMTLADAEEARTNRQSVVARAAMPLLRRQ
jgi:glycine/D-amino acid oxidase-like deaminating enzyme